MTRMVEHVQGGFRFLLAPGGTFINVKRADDKFADPPYDMMAIPEWITRSALNEEGFQMLCRLWIDRQRDSE